MANKNTAGNRFYKFQAHVEDRIVERIDQREKNKSNMENVDSAYNYYLVNEHGSKVCMADLGRRSPSTHST